MNNVWTLTIITVGLIMVFGYLGILGNEILYSEHQNLDTDSTAHILGIDDEIAEKYGIDINNITSMDMLEVDKTSFKDADPEDREFFTARKDAGDIEVGYDALINAPDTISKSIPFIEVQSSALFWGLIGFLISVSTFLAFYKFWRGKEVDNQ